MPEGVQLSLANVAADESDSVLPDWMVARACSVTPNPVSGCESDSGRDLNFSSNIV
jgi:hypothetical protein